MSARFSVVTPLLLALSLAACDGGGGKPPITDAPLYNSALTGEYDLVDSTGAQVTNADFAGQYQLIYFGYAYCPDICPTSVQRMMQGYSLFAEENPALAEQIQPIFITIDPERDTPEVVGEFTSAFSDRLIGLTGTQEQITKAAETFRVYNARGEDQPGGGYLMDHSDIVYLFGPDGQPIATLPTDQGPQAVEAELAKWVR